MTTGGTAARRDSRHRGVHEPRAGARQGRGQAHRHLGVRLRALRDAHRAAPHFAARRCRTRSSAILEREPDWTRVAGSDTAAVRRLLQRASRRIRAGASVTSVTRGTGWRTSQPVRLTLASPLLHIPGVALPGCSAAWRWHRPASRAGCSGARRREAPARSVQLQRLTDFVGMEESPAISPDGKTVAFVARAGGKRQIWLRLLAGGAPLQITRDDVDHEQPRWAPDSSSFIYFVPSATPGEHGTIWEISDARRRAEAGGVGAQRRATSAMTAGASRCFDSKTSRLRWCLVTRDGSRAGRA